MPSVTLVADPRDQLPAPSSLPPWYTMRPIASHDISELGSLYFAAYDPGIVGATIQEAEDDIRASFAGTYGVFWPDASLVVVCNDEIVCACMTVIQAPWDDVPTGPFIIELFTDRAHRRRGLGRAVLVAAMATARDSGATCIALRVDAANHGARQLYTGLGFREWPTCMTPDVG